MIERRRYMGKVDIDYSKEYLTFEALETGTFTLTFQASLQPTKYESVSYSTDGGTTWTTTNNATDTQVAVTTPSVSAGSKIIWKGVGIAMSNDYNAQPSIFSSTGKFNVTGNIKSLLYGDNFLTSTKAVSWYTFCSLFKGSQVVNAKNLYIPTWANISTNTYANGWLQAMFRDCSYLVSAPVISHITLVSGIFSEFFRNCTSLEVAPDLTADILQGSCYANMFNGCTSLNYIKMTASDVSASNCLNGWVNNVASTGTFVKKSGVIIPSGTNGIPNNWTVVEV